MSETLPLTTRFEALLEAHGAALARLAAAYAGDRDESDDLLQEICLAIWRALPSFRAECSLRTFVFRIGHNRGLTWRGRRRPPAESLDRIAELQDPTPSADLLAERATRLERLRGALRQLPETQREVVVLSLEGCTPPEIADVLGVSENTVAVRLTRARKSLRALLPTEGG